MIFKKNFDFYFMPDTGPEGQSLTEERALINEYCDFYVDQFHYDFMDSLENESYGEGRANFKDKMTLEGVLEALNNPQITDAFLDEPDKMLQIQSMKDRALSLMQKKSGKTASSEQELIIRNNEGSTYIQAAPGSGKTTTIVEQIVFQLKNGICKAEDINCITFTNKAVSEMRNRLAERLGKQDAQKILPNVRTFHSYALDIVRRNASVLGLDPNFMILNEKTAYSFFPDKSDEEKAAILDFISASKEFSENGKPGFEKAYKGYGNSLEDMVEYFNHYENKKAQLGELDFSDMIINANILLKTHPEIRKSEQHFKHMFIDEIQDSNPSQLELVSLVTDNGKKTIIHGFGDEDQSIYRWRGAVPEKVRAFMLESIGAKQLTLTKTFRCPQEICNAAAALMGQRTYEDCQKAFNNEKKGSKPFVVEKNDLDGELSFICEKIDDLHKKGKKYSDFVIQARTNDECAKIMAYMVDHKYHASYLTKSNEFASTEMRNLFSFLAVARNKASKEAIVNVLNMAGLGESEKNLALQGVSVKEILSVSESSGDEENKKKIENLRSVLTSSYTFIRDNQERIGGAVKAYYDYAASLGKAVSTPVKAAFEKGFGNISYTAANARYMDLSREKTVENDLKSDTIKITTEHSTKGLEWPVVFVTGLSSDNIDEKLRDKNGNVDSRAMLEEKNLLYVAMTRASEQCYLTYNKYSKKTDSSGTPSMLLTEIGRENLDFSYSDKNTEFSFPSVMIKNESSIQAKNQSRIMIPDIKTSKIKFVPKYHYAPSDDPAEGMENKKGLSKN